MNAATATRQARPSQPDGPAKLSAFGAKLSQLRTPWGLAVLAITALAAVVRFVGIGHQGYWYDEGNTVLLVHFSPGDMLALIPKSESTPPVYYCIAWVWARVFGYGETGLRSLSAVAGTLTVPVAYAAAAKLVSRRAGLITAALTAVSPLLIWYSQEARSYALLVLFTALALLAFAHVRATQSPRVVTAWAIASVLALATHYYAVVVVAPQALWLLYEHRRRAVALAVGAVTLCGIGLVPLALSQNSTHRDAWIAHSPLGLRLGQIIPQFLLGTGAPARQPLKFLAMALALVALGSLLAAARSARRSALLAGGLALGGFILTLIIVAAGSDALITRNIIGLWLPAAVAVAGGLALARPRALGIALSAALCAIGLTAAIGVAADRALERPDWRYVARALGTRPATATARLILIQHYRTLLPLSLYLPHLRFATARTTVPVREIDVISIASPSQPLCWWGAACNLIPSEMQASYEIPGFHVLWRRRVLQFTILRLVSNAAVDVSPAQVSASLRTTTLRRDALLIQR